MVTIEDRIWKLFDRYEKFSNKVDGVEKSKVANDCYLKLLKLQEKLVKKVI